MENPELLILGIGIAPHKTDGVLRFEYYCRMLGLPYHIVGDGNVWKGGQIKNSPGGGQKINELIKILEKLDDKLVICCDTYDLFPVANVGEILHKYKRICQKHKIVISSEVSCWPDRSLADKYPRTETKYRYLNSGCIMGYSKDLYEILSKHPIQDDDDDQLYFTLKFFRNEDIILDYRCELFQTLNFSSEDIVLHKNRVYNKHTNSYPCFLHGNGPSKSFLNHLENYLDPNKHFDYSYTLESHFYTTECPKVFMALYVNPQKKNEYETFLIQSRALNYKNIYLCLYDNSSYVFDDFLKSDCDYYFLLEQRCTITNQNTLSDLIALSYRFPHRRILSPLLISRENQAYTNYWGALDRNGYYRRSDDYFDIIHYHKRGIWNAPYVSGAILMKRDVIQNWDLAKHNEFSKTDPDMALCANFRDYTLFMYLVNFHTYGHVL